jgi:hypothetical protein
VLFQVIWTRENAVVTRALSQPLPPLPSDSAPVDTTDPSASSPGSLRFFVKQESGEVSSYQLLTSSGAAAAKSKKEDEHPRYYVKAPNGA